jgi:phosphatidylglycerophosphatase A
MEKVSLTNKIISTGFGSGYSPIAPGTAGALLATAIWLLLSFVIPLESMYIITILLVVTFTILGIYSASAVEHIWGKDPSRVVIDEMVGVWIPLIIVPERNIWFILAAFILFRLFDIFKPLGIRKMEDFKGGVGVMMDDILAGIYSFIILLGARCLVG